MQTVVELEGVEGSRFTLAGPNAGDRGVYLGTDVKGLYDPPVKVIDEEPGNYPGARFLWHRILKRELIFGVEILNDLDDTWMRRDSLWRKAWAYDRPAKLYITTEYGTRYLNVCLAEAPDVDMTTDPNEKSMNRCAMSCVAYDPFWYEDGVTYEATTTQNTLTSGSETLNIVVDATNGKSGVNPTDQPIAPVWYADAPAKWTIPDYDFTIPGNNRRIVMPELFAGEDVQIDTDLRRRQVEADNDAPVWNRMNGVRFRNMIPPYTESKTFEITVSKAAVGKTITLELPRPWSRPWGLT